MLKIHYSIDKYLNTDIHVAKFDPRECLLFFIQEKNRSRFSNAIHEYAKSKGYKLAMIINGQFYSVKTNKSTPYGGQYRDRGILVNSFIPNDAWNEWIFSNTDHKMHIDELDCNQELFDKYPKADIALGLGPTLKVNGKKDIRKAEKFIHSMYANPRTIIGDDREGNLYFIATDGRTDRGLTIEEAYNYVDELGLKNAITCDGGGSSTLGIGQKMVNDNENRANANWIAVYAKEYEVISDNHTVDLIIDPGHGGKDPGGGSNKYWVEKDMALDISLYQYKRLRELGVNVALTRDSDITLNSADRIKKIVESGAKHCISNHLNAGGGDGAETIHSIYSKGQMAYEIAECIKKDGQNIRRIFTRTLPYNNKRDYYYLHRDTGAVDTTIVEYAFADSKKDDVEQINKYWLYYAEAAVEGYCNVTGIKYIPNEYTIISKDNDELEILQQENFMLKEKVKDYEETIIKIKDLATKLLSK